MLLLGYPHEGSAEGKSVLTLCLEEGGERVGRRTLYRLNIYPVSFSPALDVLIIALNSCNSFAYSVQNIKDGGGGALRLDQAPVAPARVRVRAGDMANQRTGLRPSREVLGGAASLAFGS